MKHSSYSLAQWLSYIESMHPQEIELGLERIQPLAQQLKLLKPAPICILVAGTNGKGSTAALLQALLMQQKKRVGLYSSPHLMRFNERIKIDHQEINDERLCDCFAQINTARGTTPLTYFEFTTLAALLYFSQSQLDICVLEIGMGGRLDAVNLVDANVCVLTSIGLDHQSWLGDSLEAIAAEKAAIARPNVPLVCGQLAPPSNVASICQQQGGILLQAGVDFGLHLTSEQGEFYLQQSKPTTLSLPYEVIAQSCIARANIATAVQTLACLQALPSSEQLQRTLTSLHIPGRMQRIRLKNKDNQEFNLTLDVAHNPQAAALLTQRMGKVDGIILAMLADKALAEVIAAMPKAQVWLLPQLAAQVTRRASPTELAQHIDAKVQHTETVAEAMQQMCQQAYAEQNWLLAGSFYTVQAALQWLADAN